MSPIAQHHVWIGHLGNFPIPGYLSLLQIKKTNKQKIQVAFTWRPYSKQLSRCKVKLSQGIWVCLPALDLTAWISSLNICCLNMPLSRCRALILNQLPPLSCQRLSFAERVMEGLSDRWQSLQSPSASFSKQALKNVKLMPSHRTQGQRISTSHKGWDHENPLVSITLQSK